MVPEQRKTCTYKVCHMVPEQHQDLQLQRSATWCRNTREDLHVHCKMVPEQREDLHLPGLPHGAEQRVKTCTYTVLPHGAGDA